MHLLLKAVVSFSDVTDLVSVIIWPLVVLSALGIAVTDRGRRLLRPVLRRVRKISGGGFALELSEEAAAKTKADVEGALGDYAASLQDEFERLAYAHGVRDHLARTFESLMPDDESSADTGVRATVHVRDALYRDALYQLVDYWPGGGGSGRRFSTRFGMLGRAWRAEKSLYEPDVTIDRDELVTEWGMTKEQAARIGRGRQSLFCGALWHNGALVGIFYMDAQKREAFPKSLETLFEDSAAAKHLAAAVGEVHADIASRGPGIKLLQSD